MKRMIWDVERRFGYYLFDEDIETESFGYDDAEEFGSSS